MKFSLEWDDKDHTCVRCDISGSIGRLDWMRSMNDIAGMSVMSESGKANTLLVIPYWTFPFPTRPFASIRQMLLAEQSYRLGQIVAVVSNPITRAIIERRVMDDAVRPLVNIVSSLHQARAVLRGQDFK